MFSSIVVAFDGSAHSAKALEIGAEMARDNDAALAIVYVVDSSFMRIPDEVRRIGEVEHVIDPGPRKMLDFQNASPAMISSLTRAGDDTRAAMFQYADFVVGEGLQIAKRHGAIEIDSRVADGEPAEEILAYAKQREADLIVTGCRGFGKLKSLLLGSTSQRVAQLAECSCMTVK